MRVAKIAEPIWSPFNFSLQWEWDQLAQGEPNCPGNFLGNMVRPDKHYAFMEPKSAIQSATLQEIAKKSLIISHIVSQIVGKIADCVAEQKADRKLVGAR